MIHRKVVVDFGPDDLGTAIELFVLAHNEAPKPFIWTASARDILEKIMRAKVKLKTVQTA